MAINRTPLFALIPSVCPSFLNRASRPSPLSFSLRHQAAATRASDFKLAEQLHPGVLLIRQKWERLGLLNKKLLLVPLMEMYKLGISRSVNKILLRRCCCTGSRGTANSNYINKYKRPGVQSSSSSGAQESKPESNI